MPYIRFGILILLIKYLLINYKEFVNHITLSLSISISVLFLGFLLQIFNFELLTNNKPEFRYTSFFLEESILGSYIIKILPSSLVYFIKKKKFLYIFSFYIKCNNDFFSEKDRL